MIDLTNITKYFGDKCAIKNINLTIEKGDLFALLGPNGAGKSTILGITSGLLSPSSGDITINNRTFKVNRKEILNSIGILFENPTFYDYLSGKENLIFTARLKGHDNRKEINHLLDIVSLADRASDSVRKYSLGMRQRLALACALIGNPDILILDEPTNGLDPEGINFILSLLRNLSTKEEKTIIISSHQVYDIESLCNKIAIINEGSIICNGKLDDLLQEKTKLCIITTDKPEECKNLFANKPWIKDFKIVPNKKSLKDLYLEKIRS